METFEIYEKILSLMEFSHTNTMEKFEIYEKILSLMEFLDGPHSVSTVFYFFCCNFFGNLFFESIPFCSHVQSLSLQRLVTNSRPYPQT